MCSKLIKAFVIPSLFCFLPVSLTRPELFARPELWVLWLLGFFAIFSQPNMSYSLTSGMYKKSSDKNSAKIINGTIYLISGGYVVYFILKAPDPKLAYYNVTLLIGSLWTFFGIFLRSWSINTLGTMFTCTVEIVDKHRLVLSGPFVWVRHPSYLGSIIMFLGPSIFLRSIFLFIFSCVLLFAAYLYRIKVEEDVLVKEFGPSYRDYQVQRKKLIPGLL